MFSRVWGGWADAFQRVMAVAHIVDVAGHAPKARAQQPRARHHLHPKPEHELARTLGAAGLVEVPAREGH